MIKKTIFFVIIIMIIAAGNVFAQNTREMEIRDLQPGIFVSENLRAGQEIWYRVTSAEVGRLIVETTGSTDTYLEAYKVIRGSERVIIKEDDDGGEDTNARISIITEAGTAYLFKLRGYNASIAGAFRIIALLEPLPRITPLRIGAVFSGSIASGDDYWFSVTATQNGILTVETAGNTDTFLEVYDANFNFLEEDDDSGASLNAKIERHVTTGETYYFCLRGFGASVHGPYRLTARIR